MPHKYVIRRMRRFFVHRVLSLDDTPHRIALGVAVGMFVAWTPTIGFQMALTVLLASLVGANKFVGVPFVWISNPATVVPVYGPSFLLGAKLLNTHHRYSDFSSCMANALTFSGNWFERVHYWWQATCQILLPLWAGSILMALAVGLISYLATYKGVVAYRAHMARRSVLRQHRLGALAPLDDQSDQA